MTWMNEYDVLNVITHYAGNPEGQPNALQAACHLAALVNWTNANSDGWPYWSKPSNAAKRLQEWLSGWRKRYMADDTTDLTDAELAAMLKPVKAFLTRQGVDWREVLGH